MNKKLLLLLLLMFAWQQGQASPLASPEELSDGDVFTAKTVEGVDMTFKVISAAEKTCQVGTGNNGDATIDKSYNGPITIPASANGYKVTKVASWAFYYYRYITSITVSEGIEQFMSNSIESCYGITEFIVPASVTQISESFGGVGPLTSLSVASGNTVYDSRDNCNAIIETASNTLMVGCVNTVIPESVTAIGGWSFYYAGLQSLKIPEKVTSIGNGAFRGNNFKELVIPASVKNIGWGAFDYCHSLEKVTILPIECTIGYNAFADCSNLKEVTSYIRNPQAATSAIFYTEYGDDGAIINDNVTLHVTYGSKSSYETTEGWNNFKKIQETIHVANSSSLSVPNLKIATGGTSDLMIGVENPSQGISTVEFDIYLPTGLSITKKDGKLAIDIAGRTTEASHSIEISENGGVVHVKMSSASDALIEGVSGALLRIPLTADETFAGGEIQLKQQVLSSPDETESRPEELTVSVEQDKIITFADETVKTICVKNWDTNGDGELSEAEAAAVTSLGEDIFTRANISTFHELKYFTGLKSIGFNAFHGSKIKEVTLPETITSIGMCAFSESPLTSINFPSGLTSIGYEAFYECGLTSIDLPSSLTTINDRAFMYCDLNSVVIPAKVTYIGNDAFSGLKEITSLITNPTDIKEYAFDCYTSAVLNVPSGTKALYKEAVGWKNFYFIAEPGENLFFEVDGIRYGKMGTNRVCLIDGKNASGDYTIPYGFSYEGVWYQVKAISAGAFANNEALISIVSGIYMEEIGDNAFSGCTALKSISIGRYVKSIGTGIIGNCSALESVMSAIEEPFHVSSSTFSPWLYGSSNYKLYVPFGTTSLYQEAGWMSDESRIVEGYDGETFTAETEGENVMTFEVLSATDKTCAVVRRGIDSNTFVKRKSSDVVIPSEVNGFKVVSIKGEDVFCWVNLNSLTIPASITSIGYFSFDDRDGGSHIGTIHISDLKAWCNIDFGDNPLSYSDHLFLNGEEVRNLTIPEGITCIGQDEQVGPGPFQGCVGLESVSIPDFVNIIGGHAFDGCTNLSSVIIGSGVTRIQAYAFMGCSNLKSITIPDGVTYIGGMAFMGTGLTSVTIPSSVTSIGSCAFSGCSDLTSVKVEVAEPLAFYYPFDNVENLVLYVPKGSKAAYEAADGWKDFKEILEFDRELADGEIFTAETEGGNVLTFEVLSASDKTCEVVRKEYESNTFVTLASEDVVIPSEVNGFKVVSIGYEALIAELNSLTIPESLTSIKTGAFKNYDRKAKIGEIHITNLTAFSNIKLRDPFPSGFRLYLNGEEMTKLTIPEGISSVGENTWELRYPFSGCMSLTSVEIPDGVTSIGYGAFSRCTNLTSVSIPKTLTSIGYGAFDGCTNVTSFISYVEKPSDIQDLFCDFGEFCANATLYVPKGSKAAYKAADGWRDFKEIVEIVFGDANGDGDVDPEDVELVVNYIMNGNTEGLHLINADANGNKVLNVVDIVKMINAIKNR